MRARFWLWTALVVLAAACGLDPQPTLPRGAAADDGAPGTSEPPPVAGAPTPNPAFGTPGGVVVDLPDAELPARPEGDNEGSGPTDTPEPPEPSDPGAPAASGGEGGTTGSEGGATSSDAGGAGGDVAGGAGGSDGV